VEKDEDRFSNKPLVEACLLPGTPGNMARGLQMQAAFHRRWGHLAEAVRTGKRPEENRRYEEPESWIENFVHGLYNMARPVAPAIAESLALPEDRPLRLIDVGGCHGAFSMALAERYPRLRATIFELPRVVPVARRIIADAGMAERVSVQAGDFQQEELGRGYEIALVFGVLNGEPPEGRPALIRKVYAALNPGGQVVLRDLVLDQDRTGPLEAAIFALQMLLATESGGLDTRADWDRWLAQAGFLPSKEIELPSWVGSSLTVAQKQVKKNPSIEAEELPW
jgi:precorrin-6B methylase 2